MGAQRRLLGEQRDQILAAGADSIWPRVSSVTEPAAGINRSQPSAGGAAANNATLAKEADSSRKPTGRMRTAPIRRAKRARGELEGDNQQRGQHKERRQILLAAAGTLDLHRQGEVQLVVAQQP